MFRQLAGPQTCLKTNKSLWKHCPVCYIKIPKNPGILFSKIPGSGFKPNPGIPGFFGIPLDTAYGIWAYVKKIWSSGVSPKKASKMQLRNVDLRSVGPSVQKLWPTTFFARKMPCILHCNEKKIWISFSRLDRGLVQKAKWSEIFRRSRIQAVPTISNNLCTKCLGLMDKPTLSLT